MRARRLLVAWALSFALVALSSAPGAGWAEAIGGGAPTAVADKVLVVSLPSLTWRTVVEEQPPSLVGLFERSALASLSVRTIGSTTTSGEAYATAGAGNRATVIEPVAGTAVMVAEAGGPSGGLERRCRCDLSGWAIVHPGAGEVAAANEAALYGARPGALGTALAAAGRRTAVVANADQGRPAGGDQRHREAVLALMDGQGRVVGGTVGPELVTVDPSRPGGVRIDVDAAARAFGEAWAEDDVVLVEASDLARVDRWSASTPPPSAQEVGRARAEALAAADQLLGRALAEVDLQRHLVVVVGPTSTLSAPAQLTVAAVAGPGVPPGLATSASTRRAGYVTLPDLAPTVLSALGLPAPSDMTGTSLGAVDAPEPSSGAERMAALAGTNDLVTFRDRAVGPVSVAFVVVQLLAYGLGALAMRRRPGLRRPAAFLALVSLALPPLTFLSGLVAYPSLGLVGYLAVVVTGAAALAGAALAVAAASSGRTGLARPLVAPLVLVGLVLLVLVVDVAAGGRLQLNTVFGYSPTVAGRFFGYGNLAFALLAASAVMVVGGGWAAATLVAGAPEPRRRRIQLAAVTAVSAGVVVAVGHPSLGADVGGVLALVPGVVVVVALLAGWRVTPRLVVAIGVATVMLLGAFMAVDLIRPVEDRTHLGRTAAALFGDGSLAMIVERKARANLEILTSSPVVLLVPVILVVCAVMLARPPAWLGRLQRRVPGLRAALVGALVLGVLGAAFNDSGAAVPAMMMGVVLPYVTVLAMAEA
ncbi:MAG: hypothetical protein KY447_00655 [Actinobacteria bacterium]|nr:hypothetical protein [Actinomycetota bacterium]